MDICLSAREGPGDLCPLPSSSYTPFPPTTHDKRKGVTFVENNEFCCLKSLWDIEVEMSSRHTDIKHGAQKRCLVLGVSSER